MTLSSRYLLTMTVGLWMSQVLPGQEPGLLGLKPANQQIAHTIADHLKQSGSLHHYTVDIVVDNGTAQLSGTVADLQQRDEALRIAHGVTGVDEVRDRLSVSGGVSQVQALDMPAREPLGMPRKSTEAERQNGGFPVEPTPIYQASPSPYDLNPAPMPPYAWPTVAPYNNYSRVAYPTQYPYQAWPYIGPIYPFPKVPPGWRKVQLKWEDGYWFYSTHGTSHDWWRLRYW